MKQQQILALKDLSEIIADKEQDTVTILEDIREVLERPRSRSAEPENNTNN